MARGLAERLKLSGFAVDIEPDGASAAQTALLEPYSLIILDINLPNVSGLSWCFHPIPIPGDQPRMSEYQYYEFQAIDRQFDRAAQDTLRSISSRATITSTSFINHYEWGDFKGDPRKFMERWFDLHLYLAKWGTRRLMMRAPKGLVKQADIDR